MTKQQYFHGLYILWMLFMLSCQASEKQQAHDPPNILWLVAEDLSPYIPPFGDSTVSTPTLSRLAAEGIRYSNVYSISGVCSPSRAALATGMYPSHIGAHHMRTLFQQPAAKAIGLINYECVPPGHVKMVSEIMRENGYYCTNNPKEDYQFRPSAMAWDESSLYGHWRNRPEGKPFFSIFNFGVTHESQIFNPAPDWNLRYDRDTFPPDRNVHPNWIRFKEGESKPLHVDENLEVNIPPYLPNTQLVRQDMRRMYSNIVQVDKFMGNVIRQLEEDGLLDNTIIVFYSDHGGPLPRQKRLLYDSGLHVPMIIRYPDKRRAGEIDDRLISFVDFAPTLLSMASIEPPAYMQGQAFEGVFQTGKSRNYIHAAADRFDEQYDMIRAVRDKRFKYLKNFKPEQDYYLALEYRERMATMQELLRLRDAGELDEIQMQWFRQSKPEEELFDTENDPHELYNLANDPVYAEKLNELREECAKWMAEIGDMGHVPEQALIEQFWPGKEQPKTKQPSGSILNGTLELKSISPGASIGYKLPEDERAGIGWRIYKGPVKVPQGQQIKVLAHRIGYLPSDTLILSK